MFCKKREEQTRQYTAVVGIKNQFHVVEKNEELNSIKTKPNFSFV